MEPMGKALGVGADLDLSALDGLSWAGGAWKLFNGGQTVNCGAGCQRLQCLGAWGSRFRGLGFGLAIYCPFLQGFIGPAGLWLLGTFEIRASRKQ